MAIYSASLQQLERVRNGKRGLVRARCPTALALQPRADEPADALTSHYR